MTHNHNGHLPQRSVQFPELFNFWVILQTKIGNGGFCFRVNVHYRGTDHKNDPIPSLIFLIICFSICPLACCHTSKGGWGGSFVRPYFPFHESNLTFLDECFQETSEPISQPFFQKKKIYFCDPSLKIYVSAGGTNELWV